MAKLFPILAAAFAVIILGSTLVFNAYLGLTPIDALYFVITTITTVGYGDISLRDAPDALKIYGLLLMLSGSAFIALFFGFVTDRIISARLQDFAGKRRKKMNGHVIVCGLGQLGVRIVAELVHMEQKVVAIEHNSESKYLGSARRMGAHVVIDEAESIEALHAASIETARSIIVATDDDLINLKIAANVRQLRPDIHIVLRMFDQEFAERVNSTFEIGAAFSSTTLSAPSFAAAALDPGKKLLGCLHVDDQILMTISVVVAEESDLAGTPLGDLRRRFPVSAVLLQSEGRRIASPTDDVVLSAGDRLTVLGDRGAVDALFDSI